MDPTESNERTVDLTEGAETRRRRSNWDPANVPALTILYHPDCARTGQQALLPTLIRGIPVPLSRKAPLFKHPGDQHEQPLADRYISREPAQLELERGVGIRLSLNQSRTPVVIDGETAPAVTSFSFEQLQRGVVLELARRIVVLLHTTQNQPHLEETYDLVGQNHALVRVRHDVQRVADLEIPVLIRGETGTGKELVAKAIHAAGPRASHPFVTVNLGTVTPSLAAAELFGSVKGAYTGSVKDRIGFFQRADGGTLFLDEIGEAPAEVQVMLLRALETGEVQQVGGEKTERVDVRVIAATDADLEARIRGNDFKEPLIHRLSGYVIWMTPLRERLDDLGRLFLEFLKRELTEIGDHQRLSELESGNPKWYRSELITELASFVWPGNIRQLQNITRQIVIGSRGLPHLSLNPQVRMMLREVRSSVPSPEAGPQSPPMARAAPKYRKPGEVTEEELLAALSANRYDLKATAEQLRVSRTSLYALIEESPQTRLASDLRPEELVDCFRECQGDLDRMVDRLQVSKAALRRRLGGLGLL